MITVIFVNKELASTPAAPKCSPVLRRIVNNMTPLNYGKNDEERTATPKLICGNCDTPLDEDWEFCPMCGYKIDKQYVLP